MKLPIDMETALVAVIVAMCIERTAEDPMWWLVAGGWTIGGLLHSLVLWRRNRRSPPTL